MRSQSRRIRVVAAALSSIGGYIDAVGYLSLGGFFVSFMSGNSTRLGVGLGTWSSSALVAIGLIATFVLGVAVGAWTALRGARRAVLRVVAIAMICGATLASLGQGGAAVTLAAFAMGAVNSTFAHEGGLPVGLTYMTGTLVRIGQSLAAIPSGGHRLDWLPYALHWCSLIAGATAGALAQQQWGLNALWLGAAAMTALALTAPRAR